VLNSIVAPTGRTRVAGVVGDPIAHSLSPALHQAAFAALGLDWTYVAFPVRREDGGGIVAAVRTLRIVGLSVTTPHKESVLAGVDVVEAVAARLGAANTLAWQDGRLVAASTDGAGVVAALTEAGVDPAGRRVLVVGAGGAGRAAVLALSTAGARVTVVARRPEAAAAAAALAGTAGRVGRIEEVDGADIVVHATPAGLDGASGAPRSALEVVPVERIGSGQVVFDLVYGARPTELVRRAAAAGARVLGGERLLLHQAIEQVRLWTGVPGPRAEMEAALARARAEAERAREAERAAEAERATGDP